MTDPTAIPGVATTSPLDELGVAVPPKADGASLDSLLDMTLPVTVEFGRATLTIQEVLALGPGAVVQLDRLVGDAVELYVSDRRLAEGEIVVVGDHFGVRITKVLTATPTTTGTR